MNDTSDPAVAARAEVVGLLKKGLGRDMTYDDFRIQIEELYNFRLAPESLSAQEFKAFTELFETVVWYSPFPEERTQIPQYTDEAQVDAALQKARRALNIYVPAKRSGI